MRIDSVTSKRITTLDVAASVSLPKPFEVTAGCELDIEIIGEHDRTFKVKMFRLKSTGFQKKSVGFKKAPYKPPYRWGLRPLLLTPSIESRLSRNGSLSARARVAHVTRRAGFPSRKQFREFSDIFEAVLNRRRRAYEQLAQGPR